MAENGYNSLDLSAEDHDICIGNDGGESGDTVRRSQVFKCPVFVRYSQYHWFGNKKDSKGGGIMTIEVIRSALAWCIVINWGLLLWWFLFFTLAHDWIYRFHSKWFDLSVDKFDAIHYAGMALFKIGILLFNLVPYFALRIVG